VSQVRILPGPLLLSLRIGEDNSEEEEIFRDLWEDETQREIVVDCLMADCEIRTGRPPGL
jgi:hypothetical protein